MCYYLQVLEAVGVEDNDGSLDKGSSRDESNGSNRSDLGVDIEHNLEFRDCQKLAKFNNKQKRRLKEM